MQPLRLGEEKKRQVEGKKLQGKNIMALLLHRAAIIICYITDYSKLVSVFVPLCQNITLCRNMEVPGT